LLRECLGDTIVDMGLLTQAGSMSLVTVQPMSQGMITDDMLDCVEAGLAALQGGGSVTIDSPIEDIAALTGGLDLLHDCIGESLADMFLQMKPEFSLPEAVASPEAMGMITQEMADCVEAGLAALL